MLDVTLKLESASRHQMSGITHVKLSDDKSCDWVLTNHPDTPKGFVSIGSFCSSSFRIIEKAVFEKVLLGAIAGKIKSTNDWHLVQKHEEYIDFSKELTDFPDNGNTSVDMNLSFNLETRNAYIVLVTHNNSGDTKELLGTDINISWEEGVRILGDIELPDEMK